jgi:hypothetical protein
MMVSRYPAAQRKKGIIPQQISLSMSRILVRRIGIFHEMSMCFGRKRDFPAAGDTLYPPDQTKERSADEDDRGAGGNLDEVGDQQPREADDDAARNRQEYDPAEIEGKLGGDGDGNGEERDDEEDAYDLDDAFTDSLSIPFISQAALIVPLPPHPV